MSESFDFGGNPIERPPTEPAPAPQPGLVASFACYCGCQSEILEPAPERIRCWGAECKLTMHRWYPVHEPPPQSARPLSEADRVA